MKAIVSDLFSVFSNLIRYHRRTFTAVNWQMEVSKVWNQRLPLIVGQCVRETHINIINIYNI